MINTNKIKKNQEIYINQDIYPRKMEYIHDYTCLTCVLN